MGNRPESPTPQPLSPSLFEEKNWKVFATDTWPKIPFILGKEMGPIQNLPTIKLRSGQYWTGPGRAVRDSLHPDEMWQI